MRDAKNIDSRNARDKQYWAESTNSPWKQGLFRHLYALGAVLRQEDNKFAIKVGIGAVLFALPNYIPSTADLFAQYRGEWGLLSYALVCSMTIGASNTTGVQRFLGRSSAKTPVAPGEVAKLTRPNGTPITIAREPRDVAHQCPCRIWLSLADPDSAHTTTKAERC